MIQEVDYARLGRRIKELRISKHLTQDALSELVGCNTSHISNIENNYTKASLNVLISISNALNTSVDNLLSEQYVDSTDLLMTEIIERTQIMDVKTKEKLLKMIDILTS